MTSPCTDSVVRNYRPLTTSDTSETVDRLDPTESPAGLYGTAALDVQTPDLTLFDAGTVRAVHREPTAGFRTTKVHDMYEQIRRQEGANSLSLRRVRDLLKEQAFLDVIEQSRHSGGSAEGSYTEHKLLEDPDVLKKVLLENGSARSPPFPDGSLLLAAAIASEPPRRLSPRHALSNLNLPTPARLLS